MSQRQRKRDRYLGYARPTLRCWSCRAPRAVVRHGVQICKRCLAHGDKMGKILRHSKHYILDKKGHPVRIRNFILQAMWIGVARKPVGRDVIGQHEVMTDFLGVDHGTPWRPGSKPALFETMIFGPSPLNGEMHRWTSLSQARAGHREIVEMVRAALPPIDMGIDDKT